VVAKSLIRKVFFLSSSHDLLSMACIKSMGRGVGAHWCLNGAGDLILNSTYFHHFKSIFAHLTRNDNHVNKFSMQSAPFFWSYLLNYSKVHVWHLSFVVVVVWMHSRWTEDASKLFFFITIVLSVLQNAFEWALR